MSETDATSETDASGATRRGVLAGVGGVCVVAVLGACGDGGSSSSGSGTGNGGATAGGTGAGAALGKITGIPVGGGKVFEAQQVVVTQPKAGEFKAFSSTCTHAGCTVASVSDDKINCPCHGSQYSATDGKVITPGPGLTTQTQQPLAEKAVTVKGDSLMLG
jgi:Rieske Fe-S protein